MTTVKHHTPRREGETLLFSLDTLLPAGQALSVNVDYCIVALVCTSPTSQNPILLERPLTERAMRIFLPLLSEPHSCPHEILLASLFYPSYRAFLEGLFSNDRGAAQSWNATIQAHRQRLLQAQERKTWKQEMKPLYNVLSKIRHELHPFGLEICATPSRLGYTLISLPRT